MVFFVDGGVVHRPDHGLRGILVGVALAAGLVASAWSMDLRQAYEAALENDASIRAARAAAEAGRERLPQARSQLLPNVSFNAGRTTTT